MSDTNAEDSRESNSYNRITYAHIDLIQNGLVSSSCLRFVYLKPGCIFIKMQAKLFLEDYFDLIEWLSSAGVIIPASVILEDQIK